MSSTLQRSARPLPDEAPLETRAGSVLHDPRYQAFMTLRVGFTVLPIAMGIDKYFNSMVSWPKYVADWIDDIAPGATSV